MALLSTIAGVFTGGAAAGTAAGTTAAAGASSGISLSSIISAGTAVLGGIAEYQANSFQAAIAKQNAEIQENNALRARQEAHLKAQEQDDLTAAFLGEQIARQGGSGLSVSSGSFRATRATGRRLGRQDTLNIIDQGEVEAVNFENQAGQSRAQSSQFKSAAGLGLLGGFVRGAGSIIGSARPTRRLRLRSFAT